jgi:hypothetical protein
VVAVSVTLIEGRQRVDEYVAAAGAMRSRRAADRTPGEAARVRAYDRAWYASRPAGWKAAKNAKAVVRRAARTPEQKAGRRAKYAARTPEQKAAQKERDAARLAARTPEQKAARSAKEAARRGAWTPDQRADELAKGRERLYGISAKAYDAMYAAQGGLCAYGDCKQPATDTDHDHVSGQVRGLLCSPHNLGLGCLGDNVNGLLAGLAYLGRHQPRLDVTV